MIDAEPQPHEVSSISVGPHTKTLEYSGPIENLTKEMVAEAIMDKILNPNDERPFEKYLISPQIQDGDKMELEISYTLRNFAGQPIEQPVIIVVEEISADPEIALGFINKMREAIKQRFEALDDDESYTLSHLEINSCVTNDKTEKIKLESYRTLIY